MEFVGVNHVLLVMAIMNVSIVAELYVTQTGGYPKRYSLFHHKLSSPVVLKSNNKKCVS